MAGFDYSKSQATAARLLERFGQVGAIRRDGVDTPCTFAVMIFRQSPQDGGLIQVAVERVLIAAKDLTITPRNGDRLVYADGTVRKIKEAPPFSPAGTVVYYEAVVEGQ